MARRLRFRCTVAVAGLLLSGAGVSGGWAQSPAVKTQAQQSVSSVGEPPQAGNQAVNTPGQFDYFLLDMPWGPLFCSSIKDVSAGCRPVPGFAVHGLWPQNNNGTWPQFCSQTPAPPNGNLAAHLSMTPDLALLQHEWLKHGTCTGWNADQYFAAAHVAFSQVQLPTALIALNGIGGYTPAMALNLFYVTNPGFPQGSFSLSCKGDRVTAVQACFDRQLHPVACQGLHSCEASPVFFEPLQQAVSETASPRSPE